MPSLFDMDCTLDLDGKGSHHMVKQTVDEMPRAVALAAALKVIGQGLFDLADSLVAPGDEQPEPRPAGRPPRSNPPAEATTQDDPPTDEDEETEVEEEASLTRAAVKLADLQTLAKDLIKKGGRPKLLKILEDHQLENVSSAPAELWPVLKTELTEAGE